MKTSLTAIIIILILALGYVTEKTNEILKMAPKKETHRILKACKESQDSLQELINNNMNITTAMIDGLGALNNDEGQFDQMMTKIDSAYCEKQMLCRQQEAIVELEKNIKKIVAR
jgi:hypothetical protein